MSWWTHACSFAFIHHNKQTFVQTQNIHQFKCKTLFLRIRFPAASSGQPPDFLRKFDLDGSHQILCKKTKEFMIYKLSHFSTNHRSTNVSKNSTSAHMHAKRRNLQPLQNSKRRQLHRQLRHPQLPA